MAELLHIYRRFYRVDATIESSSYELIDPYSLSASVTNVTQNSLVEGTATTVNTLVGIYYVDLSVPLYNTNDIYEVDWQIQYTPSSPVRHLYSRFRFPEVLVQVGKVIRELDINVDNRDIRIELAGGPIDYTIEHHNP